MSGTPEVEQELLKICLEFFPNLPWSHSKNEGRESCDSLDGTNDEALHICVYQDGRVESRLTSGLGTIDSYCGSNPREVLNYWRHYFDQLHLKFSSFKTMGLSFDAIHVLRILEASTRPLSASEIGEMYTPEMSFRDGKFLAMRCIREIEELNPGKIAVKHGPSELLLYSVKKVASCPT